MDYGALLTHKIKLQLFRYHLLTSNCAHRLFPFPPLAQIFTIGTAVLNEHAGFKVFHSEPLALDKKKEANI